MTFNLLNISKILFIFYSFIAFQLSAQPEEVQVKNEKSLLWKIEGKGFKKDVYLFGTMHLIQKEYFYFPQKLKELVQNSDQLILELNDVNPSESVRLIMLENGSFFDYFSKEQTDTIILFADQNLGMKEVQFRMIISKLKPLAMVQLATINSIKGPTESFELNLMNVAKENKTPIIGLETAAQQLAIFDKLDSSQMAKMVMESIRDQEKSEIEFRKLEVAYQSQDIDQLYQLIDQTSDVLSDFSADLLDNRNSNWVQQLKKIARKKSTFIAVGAGHLGGPKGLLQQFREEGFVLVPVAY